MNVVGLEPGTIGFHKEATDLVVLIFDFSPDDSHVGDSAGGDPHFFAVKDVLIADLSSLSPHAAGVGTESRFGKAEAAELFSFLQGGQPLLFLFLAAEGINR